MNWRNSLRKRALQPTPLKNQAPRSDHLRLLRYLIGKKAAKFIQAHTPYYV